MNTGVRAGLPSWRVALGIDVACVVGFVLLGRSNHDEGLGAAGVAGVAAPFLIGLAAAWVLARAWNRPWTPETGTRIWLVTVTAGVLLRRFAWQRSSAGAFVVVAAVTLAALLMGSRLAMTSWHSRRAARHLRPTVGDIPNSDETV